MKVKRLIMRSFRGIGDFTLDLNEKEPTILIGINGVGKSSILECLAILLSQVTGQIQGSIDSLRFFNKQDIANGGIKTQNTITILLESQELTWSLAAEDFDLQNQIQEIFKLEKKLKDTFKFTKNIDNIRVKLENLRTSLENEIRSHLVEDLKIAVSYLNSKLETFTEANIPLAVYYPVNRAVIDMPLEISEAYSCKQVDAYERALMGGIIDFKSFFEWFRNREDLENERRRDNSAYRDKQLEAVRQAISSLIPDFSDLRVERSPLRMTVRKQGEELIVNQLSDGEKCLLAMVGDLARRLAIANPGLSEPLQGAGVVLIDEIELHLHPKWQREIIPALTRTFPNCQFIVTTHSPQVISQVKPEGIYILEKTDNGVIAKRPESSFGRDSNRILEDLMDVPERPQEIKTSLLELFRLIDAGNLEDARKLRQQLAAEIGADEPEFVRADVLIRRKEILNR
ncbi:SMC domain protein [Tolypothrix tenuis PCC 7101]|uniref:SMC domain protein n=1 Tax=Tolypothrix tenuis PCC 7101 TaxID=231146 RepID=A0A1Z4N9C3_9CYAN|nr:AAA family ATPase [Aulosira sp. FACHB-113]BAZ02338.1 SMC domain protein [Tolypothrix tenuis PCC 7101]BAZ73741.1 SMC domain protein [Aulosira laxa NIES-50]